MAHRMGPNGLVVIPNEMRDQLGIRPGDRVSLRKSDLPDTGHRRKNLVMQFSLPSKILS